MMCRVEEGVGDTAPTENFTTFSVEKPTTSSEQELIEEVTVSASNDSINQDFMSTQQEAMEGYSDNLDFESFFLDSPDVKQDSVGEDPGYSVSSGSVSLGNTEFPSFQEMLNDAMSSDSIDDNSRSSEQNMATNLLGTHVATEPLPSPVVPLIYCCEICSKTFTQLWILNRHYNTSHGFVADAAKECKDCGKKVDPRSKHSCLIKCSHCVLKFPSKSELRDHVLMRHTQTNKNCEICGEEFSSQQLLTRHMIECRVRQGPQVDNKSPLACPKCNKVVRSFQQLKKHEHNFNSLSHTCPVCKQAFCRLYEMFGHVWNEHHKKNREAEYTCPVCEEVFDGFRGYTYHIYDVHEGHTEDDVWKDGGRFRERKYMYSAERYRAKKNGLEKEQMSWEFEGEYNLRPDESVELEDFARSSTRIEMLSQSGVPSMLVKRRKVEFLSLPDKPKKKSKTTATKGKAKPEKGPKSATETEGKKAKTASRAKVSKKPKASKNKKANKVLNK